MAFHNWTLHWCKKFQPRQFERCHSIGPPHICDRMNARVSDKDGESDTDLPDSMDLVSSWPNLKIPIQAVSPHFCRLYNTPRHTYIHHTVCNKLPKLRRSISRVQLRQIQFGKIQQQLVSIKLHRVQWQKSPALNGWPEPRPAIACSSSGSGIEWAAVQWEDNLQLTACPAAAAAVPGSSSCTW